MIAQDSWQAYYQILSIIILKEFIKLNVNADTKIKKMKLADLNISIATAFLNTWILKMIFRIEMFMLQQKLSTKVWRKFKGTIF